MKITKDWLVKKNACRDDLEWYVKEGITEPIAGIKNLIKKGKLNWANWLIVRVMSYKQYVSYAVYSAKQVLQNYEEKYPDNKTPREAIEAAIKCMKNPTEKNKRAAASAAYAAYAADSAMIIKILNYGIKLLKSANKIKEG